MMFPCIVLLVLYPSVFNSFKASAILAFDAGLIAFFIIPFFVFILNYLSKGAMAVRRGVFFEAPLGLLRPRRGGFAASERGLLILVVFL